MNIRVTGWHRYVWSCGLLTLPILAWNIAFTRFLPTPLGTEEFRRDITPFVKYGEQTLRFAIFVLPFLMPLRITTLSQRRGILVYVIGGLLYFLSWLALMIFPRSAWSISRIGFLAPAYTPILWMIGIGFIGRDLLWNLPYRSWCYVLLACGFTAFHIAHANIVYERKY